MTPTAIIVDDEPLLRVQLRESLKVLWPQLTIVAEADHGEAAINVIATHHPDFVFLDIEMPGISGLDVAAEARSMASEAYIVFVTAFDKYAIDAFEQGAIDYLLKPASAARLAKTVARLQNLSSLAQPQLGDVLESIKQSIAGNTAPQVLQWIHASTGAQTNIIAVEDVMYFQSDTKCTLVVLRNGTRSSDHIIRLSLTELVPRLDSKMFRQIHRSTIVNLTAIHHILRDDGGNLTLSLKDSKNILKVSRSYAHSFKAM
jgi:DNA-binding LytR/AlgR family response regulator